MITTEGGTSLSKSKKQKNICQITPCLNLRMAHLMKILKKEN